MLESMGIFSWEIGSKACFQFLCPTDCLVLQLSGGLQVGGTKFLRAKCSYLYYLCAELRVSSARPLSARRAH